MMARARILLVAVLGLLLGLMVLAPARAGEGPGSP
jgi:hypothetical protein